MHLLPLELQCAFPSCFVGIIFIRKDWDWDADRTLTSSHQVHSGFLDVLESFQKKEDGTEQLADIVKELTGELAPGHTTAVPPQGQGERHTG